MSRYQHFLGFFGYIMLIFSASFLNVPILSLVSMPVFIISIFVCIYFFFSLSKKNFDDQKRLAHFLIIIGIIGLSIVIAYAAISYSDFLVAVSRNVVEKLYPSPWFIGFMIKNILFDLLFVSFVMLGAKEFIQFTAKALFFLGLAMLLSIPLTLFLVKLLYVSGIPFAT